MRAASWLRPSEYAEVVTSVADVLDTVERLWPPAGAEEWDVVGLAIGSPEQLVHNILVVVDITASTVAEAVGQGSDLIVSHHPFLLRGVTTLAEDTAKGSLAARLTRANVSVISAHTNADVTDDGASAILAQMFGLGRTQPIVPGITAGHGLGRVGTLSNPISLYEFSQHVAQTLPATVSGVRFAGDPDRIIHRVAICSGAGDSLLSHHIVQAADVYVTSDLRHHPAVDTLELSAVGNGPALIDVSHFASEWVWADSAARTLSQELPGITVQVSTRNTDPWTGLILQQNQHVSTNSAVISEA